MTVIKATSRIGRNGSAGSPRHSFLSLFILLLLIPLLPLSLQAAQVTVAWDPETDTGLAGYKLYYGTQSKNYSLFIDAGNSTTVQVPNLQSGTTYYLAATAYDSTGLESGYSNEISYTVPASCTYSISPSSQTFTSSGGAGTISVTTQGSCSWTATSGSWVTVTSGGSGSGTGTVSYSVSANTGTSRTTALTVAGQLFTVTQAGVQTYSQTYSITASVSGQGGSISPPGRTNVDNGGSQTFTISPNSGYIIQNVTVDGSSVGAPTSYTFSNVAASHTIKASFKRTR